MDAGVQCGPHLVGAGHVVIVFAGNLAAVDSDGQFAVRTIDELHIDAGLLPQFRRQTGGMTADRASNGALSDHNLFHDVLLWEHWSAGASRLR
jgi:hypothetical protein